MKRLCTILFIVTTLTFTYHARAQDDLDNFLAESAEDGEKLIGGFIAPAIKAFSLGVNQGWYNTAKPHKIAGFDLTFSGSLVTVPSSDRLFDTNALGLSEITVVDEFTGLRKSDGNIPTILGPDTPPTFSLNSTLGNTGDDFQGPGGVDLGADAKFLKNKMPAAMFQLGFGLPKGTDLKLRLVPKIDVGDGKFNLFGIGIMHDIKQHIPGIKDLPFDLAAIIGYTKIKLDVALDPTSNPDQKGLFEVKSTTIQGLISKKLSVVTFYGGLGYNIAKSNLGLLGTYDIGSGGTSTTIKDPVDLEFKASGFRATAGMRLKLAVFTFSADYTLQKYKALTLGFGINVR